MGAHFPSRYLQGFSGPHLKPRREVRPLHFPKRNKVRGNGNAEMSEKQDVVEARKRYRENNPFSMAQEMAKKCHDVLDQQVSPYQFECMIRDYFVRNGASAEVLSRNYSDKKGDCDVEADFPSLRLAISVQVKKHVGETDDWAVRQIVDYDKSRCKNEDWTYANWVVTLASDFTAEAKALARERGVVLINGEQCCRMLLSKALRSSIDK